MGVEVTVTPSKTKKVLVIILILILLGGAGFAIWKFDLIHKVLPKKQATPTLTPEQNPIVPQINPPTTQPGQEQTPTTPTSETPTTETQPATENTPAVVGDGTITLDIGGVEFESKTFQPRTTTNTKNGTNVTKTTGAATTKYRVSTVTLSITNNQANPITLNGTLIVLDSKGNNAVSSNFVYKNLDIGEIKAGETYNRKQPISTAGDIRPTLPNINKGDRITIQINLIDTASGTVIKSAKKDVTVG